MGQQHNHLSFEQRLKIKNMIDKGYSKKDIAESLSVHLSTVYREITRGTVNNKYDPQISESNYKKQLQNRGKDSAFISEPQLTEYVSHLILEKHMSIEQIVEILKHDARFADFPKSKQSIYDAIDKNRIPNVTRETLNSKSTVFNNEHVYVAKWVREELDWVDGDELNFEVVEDKLIFTKKK